MEALLILALLVCPLTMGVLMFLMMRGMRASGASQATADDSQRSESSQHVENEHDRSLGGPAP